jgi:uncharacterized protein
VKILLILTCSFVLASPAQQGNKSEAVLRQAAGAAQSGAAKVEKIDATKEADIRTLLEVSGAKTLMEQSMGQMEKNIKPLLANSLPPGDYREKLIELFFSKFHSKADTQQLLNLIVPIYDKHLASEDIKGLIAFYRTPLGRKAMTVLPQVMSEAQEQGRKWGETLGRQCMTEIMAEHPEFVKDIEDAQKAAHP